MNTSKLETRSKDPAVAWLALRWVVTQCHETARSKGWWDRYGQGAQADRVLHEFKSDIIASKLMLVVSELSEALEELREGRVVHWEHPEDKKPEGFGVELADAVIRIFDLAGWLNIDLAELIKIKMEYNETRPYRHGGKKL